jgi:hypothetical protein
MVLLQLPSDDLLLAFLEKQNSEPVYDLKYALRLCTQEGKKRACVAIYSAMSLCVAEILILGKPSNFFAHVCKLAGTRRRWSWP